MKRLLTGSLAALFVLSGCMSKNDIKATVQQDPNIVLGVLEKNPEKLIEILQKASMEARKVAAAKAEEETKKQLEEEFKNPKKPATPDNRAYRGSKEAPILIVEYSDFQCPYCRRGYQVVEELRKKYGEKVRFIFKHLPLDFHDQAMPAAKYFEAIAMQSPEKAYTFHDLLFENQDKLGSEKEALMDKLATKAGAKLSKVKRDIASETVKSRINSDMEEARNFGIQGTPGFLVNGVSVRGAMPAPHFEEIIERLLKQVN